MKKFITLLLCCLPFLVCAQTDEKYLEGAITFKDGKVTFSTEMVMPAMTKDQIKAKEGELILKQVKPADDLILLDERGKEYTSVEFAKVIQDKISYAGKDMVYVIGGAYGFSDAVYQRANSKISLSRMTFSHQMVRAIFVEQIYRAFTIMKGEPYHHE